MTRFNHKLIIWELEIKVKLWQYIFLYFAQFTLNSCSVWANNDTAFHPKLKSPHSHLMKFMFNSPPWCQQPSAWLGLMTSLSSLGYMRKCAFPLHWSSSIPQSEGTSSTELILDSCSELLQDQYCLYKGSDLSVMALPTNWPPPGAGGVSQRATFH